MAIFQWKGIEGSQTSSGEVEARNAAEASSKLKERKVIVTNMVLISGKEEITPTAGVAEAPAEAGPRKSQAVVKVKKQFKGKKIPVKMLVIFTKKFATMIEAGLPIIKTLTMLESQQEDKNFRWVVRAILDDVQTGQTLSEAFAEHPTVFDTVL